MPARKSSKRKSPKRKSPKRALSLRLSRRLFVPDTRLRTSPMFSEFGNYNFQKYAKQSGMKKTAIKSKGRR